MKVRATAQECQAQRWKITVRGLVQGVGFRPFVYRLAKELGLSGHVVNVPEGVCIEVEGLPEPLEGFSLRLTRDRPARSFIHGLERSTLDPQGDLDFQILESRTEGTKTALILPDVAVCADCLAELTNPSDHRFLYPFTHCMNCGPRYSVVESLPYDRANTSMKQFKMCRTCEEEYQDPRNRRYHAQAVACADCGPRLEFCDRNGIKIAGPSSAIAMAAQALRDGSIVAVKGLGGFHLMVDATCDDAVQKLRLRKHREQKPLAVMMPSLEVTRRHCEASPLEISWLTSPEAPIVLLRKNRTSPQADQGIAPSVAPHNPSLGVMLPYTPIHHLLLCELGMPVVATSGNLSEEPIATENEEALQRLGTIADFFLMHDRQIVRPVDDSVLRVLLGREMLLRRARGFAPLPVILLGEGDSVLCVGAHLKNTIAQSCHGHVFLSQHIGDLQTPESFEVFRGTTALFGTLYEQKPQAVACDLHPDYLSTHFAQETGLPLLGVQHHYAHILSCMAENELEGPVLGVAWDGTGFGDDGSIWGGEFLLVDERAYSRVGTFRRFRLPGGEMAVKEPRRSALGMLYEVFGKRLFSTKDFHGRTLFSESEISALQIMLESGFQSPLTSSVGRLFDGVAALVNRRKVQQFEGQAAMELEFDLEGFETSDGYPTLFLKNEDAKGPEWILDWEGVLRGLLEDLDGGCPVGRISAKFHNMLAEAIVGIAQRCKQEKIVLSGGCFQNGYLLERAVVRLRQEGFVPYWHQRIPPNDGGIALGQAVAARREGRKERTRCV